MTEQERYVKASKRGEFQWEVVEAGEYGGANRVDIEETELQKRIGKVARNNSKEFEAEVDDLHCEPFYDTKTFTSRNSARKWCGRMIRKDIEDDARRT